MFDLEKCAMEQDTWRGAASATPDDQLERRAAAPSSEDEAARTAPIADAQRVGSLDTLRGFALLGILVINVQIFAMPGAAYHNPTAWGDLTGVNFLVWLLGHVLADQKMMTIFSMLFGAGIVLFTARAAERGQSPVRLHYRRTFSLMLFGVVHAYLLWYGDILFLYAVCALVVVWLRHWPPRRLIVLGIAVVSVSSMLFLLTGASMPFWPPEARTQFVEEAWHPTPERLEEEIAAYRGGWLRQMEHRVPTAFGFHTFILVFWGFWRAAGLMLIGMGLYKMGVFSAECRQQFYWRLIAAALAVGVPLVAYGVYWNFGGQWGPLSMFFGSQFNYWGSLLVSLGWVGVVMLIHLRGALPGLRRRLAAVGRLAFTNYLLQTLICITIFYGHGLGLFAAVERVGQIAIVFGVWALQLSVSPVWLRHYRFGPVEWLWRSLTYGRLQPMRR
jgi:uncharacterized protein